uniref:Small ribosomal subunit protein uS15 n=1 Tax=Ornithorhynchus anatinus TaxID=9258 RepID=A0A6I8P588_ORNAN
MGRMHAPGKGLSQSALPYRRSVPTWLKLTSDDVKEQIYKLAKKGLTPSQIGVILRDSHGVAQVRFVTGNKILRILKSKGLAPDLPEDLYHLIKKAVAVRKHLERNRKVKRDSRRACSEAWRCKAHDVRISQKHHKLWFEATRACLIPVNSSTFVVTRACAMQFVAVGKVKFRHSVVVAPLTVMIASIPFAVSTRKVLPLCWLNLPWMSE